MSFLGSILLALVLSYTLKKSIKKHKKYYYLGAIIIMTITAFGFLEGTAGTITTDALGVSTTVFTPMDILLNTLSVLSNGSFATAIFTIVMYVTAVKNGSIFTKTFMLIRGELSVIACFLTLGHNISYGILYFPTIFSAPEKFALNIVLAGLLSIVLIVMMIPLLVTSFMGVRRKMKAVKWKKLQRSAYVFYMLIYVNVLLLWVPVLMKTGDLDIFFNVLIYSVVFLGYAGLKVRKVYMKKVPTAHKFKNAPIYVATLLIVTIAVVSFKPVLAFAELDAEGGIGGSTSSGSAIGGSTSSGSAIGGSTSDSSDIGGTTPDVTAPIYYTDGTYTNSAEGFNDDIEMLVVIVDGRIHGIKVLEHIEDEEYMVDAVSVIDKMLETQSTDVDTVSGATYSSEGIINAVKKALDEAVYEGEPELMPAIAYKDGKYTNSAEGFNDDVEMLVVIVDGRIQVIKVLEHIEDEEYMVDAVSVIDKMLETQSTDVDTVSGATYSSEGIINAVKKALLEAEN